MIEFACPNCGQTLRVQDAAAGTSGRCKRCSVALKVPDNPDPSAEPVEPEQRSAQNVLHNLFQKPRYAVAAVGLVVSGFGIICLMIGVSFFALVVTTVGIVAVVSGLSVEIWPIVALVSANLRLCFERLKERSVKLAEEREHRLAMAPEKKKRTEEVAFQIPADVELIQPVDPLQKPERVPCRYCGESIPAGAIKCRFCNEFLDGRLAVETATSTIIPSESDSDGKQLEERVRCPRCGSTDLAANSKGFGLGKAAAGGCLLGPLGLLGGVIGSRKIKITCLKCGHRFAPGQGRHTRLATKFPETKKREQGRNGASERSGLTGGGCLKGCFVIVVAFFGLTILVAILVPHPPQTAAPTPKPAGPAAVEAPATAEQEKPPAQEAKESAPAQEKLAPYKYHKRGKDESGDVMDLYFFSGKFDQGQLKQFCEQERLTFGKSRSKTNFYYITFFDSQKNAAFPTNPFTGGFADEKNLKHIRATYGYNFVNGWSELTIYNPNAWTGKGLVIE